jgi:hypothetical protein
VVSDSMQLTLCPTVTSFFKRNNLKICCDTVNDSGVLLPTWTHGPKT